MAVQKRLCRFDYESMHVYVKLCLLQYLSALCEGVSSVCASFALSSV
jgi:hypothetical protein